MERTSKHEVNSVTPDGEILKRVFPRGLGRREGAGSVAVAHLSAVQMTSTSLGVNHC